MAVAKCYYDLIYEELKRPWDQPMLFDEHRKPIFGNHYQSVPRLGICCWDLRAFRGMCQEASYGFAPIFPNRSMGS